MTPATGDPSPTCVLKLELAFGPKSGEPNGYILSYTGRIYSGIDVDKSVGHISFHVVDLLGASEDGVSAWEVLDCLDGNLAHFCNLIDVGTDCFKPRIEALCGVPIGRILVFDRLEIDEPSRGKGLGLQVIQMVVDRLGGDCCMAVLRAFPLQWEGRVRENRVAFRRDRAKLSKYYRAAGFSPVIGDGLMARRFG